MRRILGPDAAGNDLRKPEVAVAVLRYKATGFRPELPEIGLQEGIEVSSFQPAGTNSWGDQRIVTDFTDRDEPQFGVAGNALQQLIVLSRFALIDNNHAKSAIHQVRQNIWTQVVEGGHIYNEWWPGISPQGFHDQPSLAKPRLTLNANIDPPIDPKSIADRLDCPSLNVILHPGQAVPA